MLYHCNKITKWCFQLFSKKELEDHISLTGPLLIQCSMTWQKYYRESKTDCVVPKTKKHLIVWVIHEKVFWNAM